MFLGRISIQKIFLQSLHLSIHLIIPSLPIFKDKLIRNLKKNVYFATSI